MVQIAILIGAVPFFVVGIKAITGASLNITTEKKLEGSQAKIVGTVCIAIGVAILLLAFVALPMLMS